MDIFREKMQKYKDCKQRSESVFSYIKHIKQN